MKTTILSKRKLQSPGADQTGSQLFTTRVNRAFVTGNGGNAGDVDIEAGSAGGTTVARITAGYGQTTDGSLHDTCWQDWLYLTRHGHWKFGHRC